MRRAILAWENHADTASIMPSSEVPSLPAANLQDPQPSKPWRTAVAGAPALTVDLFAAKRLDVLALVRTNLTPTGTLRVRASNLDSEALTSLIYDSGVIGANVDARFGLALHLLPEGGVTAQYWRIDLGDISLDYYEAGRLVMAPAWSPSVNYSYGWSQGYIDLSKRTRTRGGQTYVDANRSYRVFRATFGYLNKAEAEDGMLELDRVIGLRHDVLALLDPDDMANPGRSALWGMLGSLSEVSNPEFDIYQKSLSIEERI